MPGSGQQISDKAFGHQVESLAEKIVLVRREISKAIVGQHEVVAAS